MPRIELITEIAASPQRCFELSLSVDAHRSSMANSGERAIAGVTSGVLGEGDAVTWRARHFGIRFTMTSTITQYDYPHRFVDEQQSGPFRSWWHEHRFKPMGGATVMTDVVQFESPAGPIGRLVNDLVLTRYLTQLLQRRNAWLADALSTPDA